MILPSSINVINENKRGTKKKVNFKLITFR